MSPRRVDRVVLFVAGAMAACLGMAYVQQHREGYKDTPILPGQKWHVHDPDRPYPHEIAPGAHLGDPPSDAVVLFDGTDLSHWKQAEPKGGGPLVPAKWKLNNGTLEVAAGTGSLSTRDKFGDCQLHIEWREPEDVQGSGQGRGNSGVFLMGQYEVQVLDSYRAHTYADGQAGALYGQWPPLVNPARKPGEWQVYDIIFERPHWEGGKVVKPAYMTVFFNGVLVHNHQKLNGATGHASIPPYEHHADEEPIVLQDHGPTRPLRFRNIWARRLLDYDQPEK